MAFAKVTTPLAVDRETLWLMTYISLFTSLLAFFVLSMTMVELEGSQTKRNFQKIQHDLYMQVMTNKKRLNLDWLTVDETVTKGTRLTLRADDAQDQEIFRVGSDKVSAEWQGKLQDLAVLISELQLDSLATHYAGLLSPIDAAGYQVVVQLLVEGHTDEQPMSSARFPSNWELSTARALQVQQLLQMRTALPPQQFAIAGLGSFRPVKDSSNYAQNRRVEIYLNAVMQPKDASIQ
jgi:chemotaxis protein MotB